MANRLTIATILLAPVAGACSGGTPASTLPTTAPRSDSTDGSVVNSPVVSASQTTPASTQPVVHLGDGTAVVLDYSPTVSDIGALLLVATHPDLDLIAVTVTGSGESHCGPAVAHTRGVLTAIGKDGIPVACGPERPIAGDNAFPDLWRAAADALPLPEGDRAPGDGVALLIEAADAARGSLSVLAVGPLTNVALALERRPDLAEKVAITIMGGAVDVNGNVFANFVAEWNIWVDPEAAHRVLASGAPVTLVPLDATNHLPASRTFFDALADYGAPAASLLHATIATNPDWYSGGFYFWDELAAAVIAGENVATFETRSITIVRFGTFQGWTLEDRDGVEVRVAVDADRRAFEDAYLRSITGDPMATPYLTATAAELEYLGEFAAMQTELDRAIDELFTAAAAAIGEDDLTGAGLIEVVRLIIPDVLGEVFPTAIGQMAALQPPESLAQLHAEWMSAARAFVASGARIAEDLLDAETDNDLEAIFATFEDVSAACTGIQAATARRDLAVGVGWNC